MIDDESFAQYTLTLELPEADAEEIDALTRQLRDEILEAPVESVEFVPDAARARGN